MLCQNSGEIHMIYGIHLLNHPTTFQKKGKEYNTEKFYSIFQKCITFIFVFHSVSLDSFLTIVLKNPSKGKEKKKTT